jgi:hypothetical protein
MDTTNIRQGNSKESFWAYIQRKYWSHGNPYKVAKEMRVFVSKGRRFI